MIAGIRYGLAVILCAVLHTATAESAEIDIPMTSEAVQKGAEVAANVCLGCHNLKYIKYSDLSQIGLSGKQVDVLRGSKSIKAAMETDMDPSMLRDSFGLVPPDLSLMAKAREGGSGYIFDLLTGFYQKTDGSVDNHVFPGVKMPDVLSYSDAKDPAQRAAVVEQAMDVAAFLSWAADPHAAQRHRLGYYVLGYLVLLTFFLYLSKRRIWARLH